MYSEAAAADQVLRLTMDGFIYFFKVSGVMAEDAVKLLGMISKAVQENTKGSTSLKAIIREGSGIVSFQIPKSELKVFGKQSSEYRLRYCAISPATGDLKDSLATVIVSRSAAPIANTIIKTNRLHGRMITEMENGGQEQEVNAPIQKAEEPAPEQAATEKAAEMSSVKEPQTPEEVAEQNAAFLQAETGTGPKTAEITTAEPKEPELGPTSAPEQSASMSDRSLIGSSGAGGQEKKTKLPSNELWPETEPGRISVQQAAQAAQRIADEHNNGPSVPGLGKNGKEPTMYDTMIARIEAQNQQRLDKAAQEKGE